MADCARPLAATFELWKLSLLLVCLFCLDKNPALKGHNL